MIHHYCITRSMHIVSTVVGYDIYVAKVSDYFGDRKVEHYRNISASTIRRFYRLSNNCLDVYSNKSVPYTQHNNLFPWP